MAPEKYLSLGLYICVVSICIHICAVCFGLDKSDLQIYVGVLYCVFVFVYCVFVFVYCIVDCRCSVSGINSDKAHLMAVQGGGHPRSITVLLREQRSRALLYLSFAYIMYKSFSPMGAE